MTNPIILVVLCRQPTHLDDKAFRITLCLCGIFSDVLAKRFFGGDWGSIDISSPKSQQNGDKLVDVSVPIGTGRKEGQLTLSVHSNDGSWPHNLGVSKST